MKFDIGETLEIVRESLAAANIDEGVIKQSLAKIQEMAKEIKEEEKGEKVARPRKPYVCVGFNTDDPNIISSYLFQCDSNVEPHTILEKLEKVKNTFNESKKGRKAPVKSLKETIEVPANKFYKALGVARKTKEAFYTFLAPAKKETE